MSALKKLPKDRAKVLSSYRVLNERGFTLMEVTLTVALVLILSIGGFMAYQGFTDNAKRSAVESAANEVFNAAVATLMLPAQETSATEESDPEGNSGGVQFASHRVATVAANPAIAKIQEDYNAQSENIQVLIEQAGMDVTVTATGWDGEYTAVRSTIPENDGVITGPGDNEEENSSPDDETGIMVMTWDVSKSNNTVRLPILRIQGSLKIDWGDGTVTEDNTLQHNYEASDDSVYTIKVKGKFSGFGSSSIKDGLISVDEWRNTGTTDLSRAFYIARDLKHVHEIPSGVENMGSMFYKAESFNQDVSSWDVSNVKNMRGMFSDATSFNNGDAPGESNNPLDWEDTSQVKDMGSMFREASSFNQDVSSWDVSKVESMESIFRDATSFNNGDAPGESNNPLDWEDTSQVNKMDSMFDDASSFNQDISDWDVSNVTYMSNMFQGATSFNNGDAPGESNNPLDWKDTLEAEDREISYMFYKAESFNQDLSNLVFSNVKDMDHMFYNAHAFNQDVNSWDVSNVTNMSYMFYNARSFNNGDAPGESNNPLDWEDTSQLTTMRTMFLGASSFNQDVSNLDVSNVTNMDYMFYNATAFNNGDAPGESNNPLDWEDTSQVNNMSYMFRNASSFNQDISNWDVSNVKDSNTFADGSSLAPEHRPSFT